MSYDNFMWKIIYKILGKEKNINIVIDKDKQNPENIDEKVVDNILKEKYMHGGHLDVLKSMFNMVLLHHGEVPSSGEDFTLPYLDPSILKLLNSFRLASLKESAEGYAMFSNFKSIDDMVIIKTSRTKKDNRGILFEYFIGTIGINKLRSLVPNFAYILAIFKCNPLPIGKDKKIDGSKFCKEESDDSRFYVVYEKIKGMSLNDFVKNMVDENDTYKLLGYIMQIVFALIIAQREIGYVHYDLHTDNIMLRILPSPKVIEYDIDGKTYRIETDAIPTIIDYGFSHFVYNGIPLGGSTIPEYGIIPTLTCKGFDTYKFIMYIMNTSFKQNKKNNLFENISWMIEYFKDDQFGIYKAYKSKKVADLNLQFNYGFNLFYNVTGESPIYRDNPINFINWVQNFNKPFWDKKIKVSESSYNIPSNNIVENYRAKIDGRKIFNSHILDDMDDCSILDTDHRSYIINKYVSSEFSKILENFEINIKHPDILRKKIKLLSKKNEKNKESYNQNDLTILSIYTDELISVQKSIYLPEYENRISKVNTILDIKRLYDKMKILHSYIETYNNYKIFIEYSKISSRISTDSSIDEYHSKTLSIYKSYEQVKSEYIFESLRKKLDIINNVIYDINKKYIDPFMWNVSHTFIDALTTIQYVIDDIRLFYPEIEYAYITIENNVYNICLSMITKRGTLIYVPPRSGIQMKIALYSRELLEYIMYKNFNIKGISIPEFIDFVIVRSSSDEEIYKKIENTFTRKDKVESFKEIKYITDNELYKRLKLEDKLTLLDTGSPEMSKNLLDYIGVDESNIVTVNLSGSSDSFINQTEISENGNFPFSSNYFSIITALMVLHNIDDIESALLEIYRVLKPNGIFIIKEYDSELPYQKIISDIDTIISRKRTVVKSFYMSSNEIKNILRKNKFLFVDEKVDSRLTKYFIFSK